MKKDNKLLIPERANDLSCRRRQTRCSQRLSLACISTPRGRFRTCEWQRGKSVAWTLG